MGHPETSEAVYGAGVEFGLLMCNAVKTIPVGGFVALINLSWDSGVTGMSSRSAIPICMQVIGSDRACDNINTVCDNINTACDNINITCDYLNVACDLHTGHESERSSYRIGWPRRLSARIDSSRVT